MADLKKWSVIPYLLKNVINFLNTERIAILQYYRNNIFDALRSEARDISKVERKNENVY
jgi:hypothetical protein